MYCEVTQEADAEQSSFAILDGSACPTHASDTCRDLSEVFQTFGLWYHERFFQSDELSNLGDSH